MSDCEREHRCGNKLGIKINFYSVACKNLCRAFCKNIRVYARIVSYRNARRVKLRVEIIGKTLCCLVDGKDIHSVCACADNSAQSACAELKIFVEAVKNFIIFALDRYKLVINLFFIFGVIEPKRIKFFDIVHKYATFIKICFVYFFLHLALFFVNAVTNIPVSAPAEPRIRSTIVSISPDSLLYAEFCRLRP